MDAGAVGPSVPAERCAAQPRCSISVTCCGPVWAAVAQDFGRDPGI